MARARGSRERGRSAMSEVERAAGGKRLLPALVTVTALLVLGTYLWRNRAFVFETYALDPGAFALVALLSALGLALRAAANQLHFGALGVALPAADWFRLVAMTSFTNYLPLSAGLLAKALFLKRVHDVAYGHFAAGQTTLLLVVLSTNGAIGLVILAAQFPQALFGAVGAGFGVLTLSGAALLAPEGLRRKLSPRWFRFDVGVGSARSFVGVAATQAAMLAASAASLWLCFAMGEGEVGYLACVLFTAAAVITRFVTVVPGALGVREFVIGGLAVLVGFELRDAVVAAALARAAEMVVVFAFGGAFTFSFSRELTA
jgi:uncharacterized membrane protein YbhN (UPF0104 family)